jgi:hypothetical protein
MSIVLGALHTLISDMDLLLLLDVGESILKSTNAPSKRSTRNNNSSVSLASLKLAVGLVTDSGVVLVRGSSDSVHLLTLFPHSNFAFLF